MIPRFQGHSASLPQRSMSSISGFGPSASFDTASDLLETAEDEITLADEANETQSERGAQIREPHPSMRYRKCDTDLVAAITLNSFCWVVVSYEFACFLPFLSLNFLYYQSSFPIVVLSDHNDILLSLLNLWKKECNRTITMTCVR